MAESLYTPRLAALICERMAKGESLRSICEADNMPAESTVRLWAVEDRDGFAAQYARARETQMDALAEDIIEIADDSGFDAHVVDGRAVVDGEAINRARLRVDARKWLMSKIAPKRYGDKMTMDGDLKIGADATIAGLLERIAENGKRIVDKD